MKRPNDFNPSALEKKDAYIRAQLARIDELQRTIDSFYHQLAAICRRMEIKPKTLVKEVRNHVANYQYLADCMREEQKLDADAKKKTGGSLRMETQPENINQPEAAEAQSATATSEGNK